ncbi:MAG TPA: NAD(P)H-hydrate dehydratase, partial [Acidimicrobiales bacterium]|nr:NAD(P)H-hydrate dehydratase [Acidimicrobiales bacterium]
EVVAGAAPGPDRLAATRSLAADTGAVVLLKGSTTVVAAPDGRVLLSAAGGPRLATAGTGDVLSGVIGAFLAAGLDPLWAAALGAQTHGLAASRGLPHGLLAGDLPELVAAVLSELLAGERAEPNP